jgi:hypothetical protein
MGRIAKLKRELITEANKRLLGEQEEMDPRERERQEEERKCAELVEINEEYIKSNPNGEMEFDRGGLININGKSHVIWDYDDCGKKSFGQFWHHNLGRAGANIHGKFTYTLEGDTIKITPTEDNQNNYCRENECFFKTAGSFRMELGQ